MNDRCIRVSAYVDGREVGASRSSLRCALVERDEFLEVELLAGIALDALHDALAAYGAVVRDVIVHAAVLLGAEYTAAVHVAAFVNVDDVAVARVENQVAPVSSRLSYQPRLLAHSTASTCPQHVQSHASINALW